MAIKEVVPAKIPTPNAMIIKEIGKALPICSLLYHTVEIVIDIP